MTKQTKDQDSGQSIWLRAFSSTKAQIELPSAASQLTFWSLVTAGITLDLWSKWAVFKWLEQLGSFTIIDGFLQLIRTVNDGAAFGIASGRRNILVLVSVVALIFIVGFFLFFSRTQPAIVQVVLALFTAGICGNLYDRIFNDGLVRDFIDVVYWPGRHWPAFNVADSMLCIAVGLMMISSMKPPKRSS